MTASMIVAPMPRRTPRLEVRPTPLAICVRDLHKSYDGKPVLRGVSLELSMGRVLGVLGPNGAGKTTLLESIEGLRRIDSGSVEVLGRDMRTEHKAVQRELGVQLQKTSLFKTLTVREMLRLFATLYDRRAEAEYALARFGLTSARDTFVANLSGGQYQRFSLCLATLNAPRLLFLDEPTTGLDPHARRLLWSAVMELRAAGTAVVLTTHYMDEVETLCDEVLVLRDGSVVARGTPRSLAAMVGAERSLVIEPAEGESIERVVALFANARAQVRDGRVHVSGADAVALLNTTLRAASAHGVRIGDVSLRSPTLEDAFVALTTSDARASLTLASTDDA